MPLEKDLKAGDKWTFDAEVAGSFDSMLARSVPGYASMRELTTRIAQNFIRSGSVVLDLGCSRGTGIGKMMGGLSVDDRVRFVGLDDSDPMLEEAKKLYGSDPVGRYSAYWAKHSLGYEKLPSYVRSQDGNGSVRLWGLSLVTSVLTLQFVPIEYRAALVAEVYERLSVGGAFLVVEKVLGPTSKVDDLLVGLHHDTKREAGYSDVEIDAKRRSLAGVMVPVTAAWNEELIRQAGFRHVDCVWRNLNFAAWVAIKEG